MFGTGDLSVFDARPLALEQNVIVVAVNYHLGLLSAQALVSHDDAFLENLALTDNLQATEQGWHLEPQPS
ncbi:hypothetical protein ACT3TJ_16625 [Halomonas sp. AOP30-A1-24]|uniref:hypothetical protein n=1 Tax=Halomonas sp. AOP30-A1-24 TaxID=3457698 RepID=UPI0040339A28